MWSEPQSGGVEWVIDASVRALVTTRDGGVSAQPRDSLNLSFAVGDDPTAVKTNRSRVAQWFGKSANDMVWAEQVHEGRVAVVTLDDVGAGTESGPAEISAADGLVTADRGLILGLVFADCVPIFLASPANGWVGVVHAGWRGTAAKIAVNAVAELCQRGVPATHIWAGIGPSIGPCCYEVDGPVVDRLCQALGTEDTEGWAAAGRPGHYQLDLWQVNRRLLREAGVPDSHIETSGLCTACHPQWFFSHRRDHGRTGRIGSFICRR